MLSLDAVLVAIVWQQLLMRSFCDRGSTWPEAFSLGATVWLIYVADRLLDGARLDTDAPHTLRHGFYRNYRRVFLMMWIIVLAINTFVVTHCLPQELLRGGVLLASAVLIYGASVHFSALRFQVESRDAISKNSWLPIPKEVRVGVLFALGVSLCVWTPLIVEGASWRRLMPLAMTTGVMSVLFGGNCMLVAWFEQELDRTQSFPSIATNNWNRRHSGVAFFAKMSLVVMTFLPVSLLIFPLPFPVLITALISSTGLCLMAVHRHRSHPRWILNERRATFDIRGAWVDAAVWMPPLMMLLLSGIL